MLKKTVIALVTTLMLLPAVQAQGPGEVTLSIDDRLSGAIPADGPTAVNFTLTVGCDVILEGGGTSVTMTVSTDLPEDFGSESKDVTISADQNCLLGGGAQSVSDSLSITPSDSAMGNNKTTFKLMATDGTNSAEAENSDQVWIDYVPGHTIDPEITFPYTMTADDGPELAFNLTVTVDANSNTMVMFMETSASVGDVTGFSHEVFDLKAGDERTRVKTITFIPPEGDWDNATIEFFNFSHCLDSGFECTNQMEQNITWTIQNGGVATNSGGGGGGGEDSPSPGAITLILGLLAAAFIASRRR